MSVATSAVTTSKQTHRSRVTNGTALLSGVDGRSVWARRLRDLIESHVSDLGGNDAVTAAERSIVRRAATLTVELERMETVFAGAGEASPEALDLYGRTAGNLRRLLESVGLQRRARDITPSLQSYLAQREGRTA
ncbi:hypothetical protein AB7M49_008160 [Bradyrhizobium elkanii]